MSEPLSAARRPGIGDSDAGHPTRREVLRISAAVGVAAAFGGGVSVALLRQAGLHTFRQTRSRMGTIVTITVTHPDAAGARTMVEDAFADMARLEAVLTRHRATAPLARLNADGRLVDTPPELLEVLGAALRMAELSDGAFDPTILPILEAWATARAEGREIPWAREVEAAKRLVGFTGVHLSGDEIALERPGMGLTLDGIAKGYVVDRTTARLVSDGAERVLVDAGGDMASGGSASLRDPWTVAIEDPHGGGAMDGLVRLAGGCVATSGDYLHSYTEDRRHHHIVDPRTGRSPARVSAVTVMAGRAMDADALSTALMVLGPDAGIDLVDREAGAEAMIVDKDGARRLSSGFALARA